MSEKRPQSETPAASKTHAKPLSTDYMRRLLWKCDSAERRAALLADFRAYHLSLNQDSESGRRSSNQDGEAVRVPTDAHSRAGTAPAFRTGNGGGTDGTAS